MMRNVPPVIVRWQHPLSRLRRFAVAALDKAFGSGGVCARDHARAYAGVRPPKNEQLNLARNVLYDIDFGSIRVTQVDVEIAILRALCGIGGMLHELLPDIEVSK